jgi:hypothetical protein
MTHQDNLDTAANARDEAWRYSKLALAWHGWGSPVGLGLFLASLGLFLVLARRALMGA